MEALIALSAILITFLGTTFLGYGLHWLLHQKWSGALYEAHMVHHIVKYPPWDMESEKYRSAGWQSGFFAFIPASITLMCVLFLGLWTVSSPTWIYVVVFVEGTFLGVMHEVVHDAVHMKAHWFHRAGATFWHLRKLHRIHHRNMRKNFGVIWFGWDKFFRTYRALFSVMSPEQSKRMPRA